MSRSYVFFREGMAGVNSYLTVAEGYLVSPSSNKAWR